MGLKKIILSAFILCLSISSNAKIMQKQSSWFGLFQNNHEGKYIEVEVQNFEGTSKVGFQFCDMDNDYCEQIGPKDFYNTEELLSRRSDEYWQAHGVVAADIGLITLAFVAGAFLVVAEGGITVTAAITGSAAAGTTAGVLGSTTKVMNPVEQYKQAMTLKDRILRGDTIEVNSVIDFAQRLDTVLSKLD